MGSSEGQPARHPALSGLGLLVGVIVGAGMFALPYAVAQAGLVWGVVHMIIAFCVLTLAHILYGEVVYISPGTHRLPGYARMHLGSWAGRLALLSALIGFYGALVAYGILGGVFLSHLFALPEHVYSLSMLFFIAGAAVLALRLARVGFANFILTALLVVFVLILAARALPHVNIHSFPLADNASWFLPYGIFLFAFAGASTIPDVADIFAKKRTKLFRHVVILATIIPLFLYVVFVASVVGVTGVQTPRDAISGLAAVLGSGAVRLGSLIGLLAVFTSFLALGADLKNIFRLDYHWPTVAAWAAVVAVPPALFLLGFTNFIAAVGLVGAVAIGIDGAIIVLMALAVRRKGLVKPDNGFLRVPYALLWVVAIAFALGMIYELTTFFV